MLVAREVVVVEHVNRRFKVFRIFSQRYRNRRQIPPMAIAVSTELNPQNPV